MEAYSGTKSQRRSSFLFQFSSMLLSYSSSPMKPFTLGTGISFILIATIGMAQILLRVSSPSNGYLHQQLEKRDIQLTGSLTTLKKNPREIRFHSSEQRPVRYKLIPYHLPVNRYDKRPLHSHHFPAMSSSLLHRSGRYNSLANDRSGYAAPICCSNNNFPSLLFLVIPFGLLLFVSAVATLMQTITITASATAMASSQQQQTQQLINLNTNTITNTNSNSNNNSNDIDIDILVENLINATFVEVEGDDYDDGERRRISALRLRNHLLKLNSLPDS